MDDRLYDPPKYEHKVVIYHHGSANICRIVGASKKRNNLLSVLSISDYAMSDINCESCGNYIYDEEFEEYYCQMELDEDEYGRLLQDSNYRCPYFIFNDEYKIVRKQI